MAGFSLLSSKIDGLPPALKPPVLPNNEDLQGEQRGLLPSLVASYFASVLLLLLCSPLSSLRFFLLVSSFLLLLLFLFSSLLSYSSLLYSSLLLADVRALGLRIVGLGAVEDFLDFDDREIANQLTLLDFEVFSSIPVSITTS